MMVVMMVVVYNNRDIVMIHLGYSQDTVGIP